MKKSEPNNQTNPKRLRDHWCLPYEPTITPGLKEQIAHKRRDGWKTSQFRLTYGLKNIKKSPIKGGSLSCDDSPISFECDNPEIQEKSFQEELTKDLSQLQQFGLVNETQAKDIEVKYTKQYFDKNVPIYPFTEHLKTLDPSSIPSLENLYKSTISPRLKASVRVRLDELLLQKWIMPIQQQLNEIQPTEIPFAGAIAEVTSAITEINNDILQPIIPFQKSKASLVENLYKKMENLLNAMPPQLEQYHQLRELISKFKTEYGNPYVGGS